ncbi:hypothetical protein ACQEU8_31615 [Streptomyces sp. CA-250714]|uniref:hypothetical protein n=1 Tax=Streptomyces sp. CA-250714 TaxID=3240060 RepID=UPI003D917E82
MTVTANTDRHWWQRNRRGVASAMLVAGLLLLLGHPLGSHYAETTHLVVLRRVFDGPVPHVAAAAALLIAGATLRPLRPLLRIPVVIFGVLALLGCLALSALVLGWDSDGWAEGETVEAPGGADRRAVSWRGSSAIDPVFQVTVIHGTGLGAREWEAACFNGDDPRRELKRITWATPSRLLLTDAGGHQHVMQLDARTGRPDATLSVGC